MSECEHAWRYYGGWSSPFICKKNGCKEKLHLVEAEAMINAAQQLSVEVERLQKIMNSIECGECGAKGLMKCTCPDGYLALQE